MPLLRHLIGLAIALGFTLMIFFGAGYFGAVWTHYFSGEPESNNTGEVSVKIVPGERPCPEGKPC